MRLYTRYRPTRPRRRPWRLWLSLVFLGGALYAWLRWEPRVVETPQDVLLRAAEARAPGKSAPGQPPAPADGQGTQARGASNPPSSDTRPDRLQVGSRGQPPAMGVQPGAEFPVDGRPVENIFEAQLALARMGISPGSLDGVVGSRTRNALRVFQQREQLPVTGQLDAGTKKRLRLEVQPFTNYVVTTDDLSRLLPVGRSWVAKSEQPRLDYADILELVAERSWTHPDFLRRLNGTLDWSLVQAGMKILVPNVAQPTLTGKAALVRIQLSNRALQVFDERVHLMAHYPCTIARNVDNRPLGELRVEVIISMPNYTFNPERFAPTAEIRAITNKLILPPGPNNPVGTVWIGLNRSGYGIHGTPEPEKIGGAESLGCFRLANWNAEHLARLVWVGMPVHIEP